MKNRRVHPASIPRYETAMRFGSRFGRVLVAAAGAVITMATMVACTTDVLHDLDETSANASVSALDQAGIAAQKVASDSLSGGRYALRVPDREAIRALAVLKEQGLPRQPHPGYEVIYGRPGLIPSPSEERARFVLATVGEVERTLEGVAGVVGARVHLVPEEADPNALDGRKRNAARAAVLLKVQKGLLALAPAEIQRLVAGSVPGLDPDAVSVILAETATLRSAPSELAALGPFWVGRASRSSLIAVTGLVLILIGALSVLLLIAVRRRPQATGTATATGWDAPASTTSDTNLDPANVVESQSPLRRDRKASS